MPKNLVLLITYLLSSCNYMVEFDNRSDGSVQDCDSTEEANCNPSTNTTPSKLASSNSRARLSQGKIESNLAEIDFPKETNEVAIGLAEKSDCSDFDEKARTRDLISVVNISSDKDGDFYVCYLAYDSSNNNVGKYVEPNPITLDVTKPVVSLPNGMSLTTSGGALTIAIDVQDKSSYSVSWSASPETGGESFTNQTDNSVDFTSANEGVYEVTAVVKDAFENTTTVKVTVTVDSSKPVIGNDVLNIADLSSSGFTLNWNKAADTFTTQSKLEYRICRSSVDLASVQDVAGCLSASTVVDFTKDASTYSVSGLAHSTTLYFNVLVKDEAGNYEVYSPVSVTTLADTLGPTVGSINAATAVGMQGYTISWTAASDNHTPVGSLEYLMCSSTDPADVDDADDCEGAVVEAGYTAAMLSTNVTGKNSATTYYVNVVVKDASGNRSLYVARQVTTSADSVAPTAGAFSAATNITRDKVTLNWTAASDNITIAANIEYLVCQSTVATEIDSLAECYSKRVDEFDANITSYELTSLQSNTTYYVRVIARDAADNRVMYAQQSVTTLKNSPILAAPGSKLTLEKDVAMMPYSFTNTGGNVVSCSIDVALPSGLSLAVNSNTCRITGMPTELSAVKTYEITAESADTGTATVSFDLEVVDGTKEWIVPDDIGDTFVASNDLGQSRVALSENGDAIIMWETSNGLYFRHRKEGVWSAAPGVGDKIPTTTNSTYPVEIKMNIHGDAMLVYLTSPRYYISTYINGTWTHPTDADDFVGEYSNTYQYASYIGDDKRMMFFWMGADGGSRALYGAEKVGAGSWTQLGKLGFSANWLYLTNLAVNASGDFVFGYSIDSGSGVFCLVTFIDDTLSVPVNPGECQNVGSPSFPQRGKVALSNNGRIAYVYIAANQMYLHEYNGTSWTHPSSSSDTVPVLFNGGYVIAPKSIFIADNGDLSLTWTTYSSYGMDEMFPWAFHTYRLGGIWTHPDDDTSQKLLSVGDVNYFSATMFSVGNGVAIGGSYGGSGNFQVKVGIWKDSWTALASETANLSVPGTHSDLSNLQYATNRYGNVIVVWSQFLDPGYNTAGLFIAEFN